MCFRKAAVVVPLLQGLTKAQIVSHTRFAAKMGFNTSHLEPGHRSRSPASVQHRNIFPHPGQGERDDKDQ